MTKDLLNPTRLKMLALLAEGLSNKEIAARIPTSEQVVKNNMFEVGMILNLRGRVRLARWYWERVPGAKRDGATPSGTIYLNTAIIDVPMERQQIHQNHKENT